MSITLPHKLVIQVQKYFHLVWVALTTKGMWYVNGQSVYKAQQFKWA